MAAVPASADALPSDVLCNICEHTLPSLFGGPQLQAQKFGGISPLNMSMVCRAWRSAIANQPSLWGRIRLDKPLDRSRDKWIETGLRFWLKKSSDVPLTVHARVSLPSDDLGPLNTLSLLFSEQHRWKNVDITVACPAGPGGPATPARSLKIYSPSLVLLRCDFSQYLRRNNFTIDVSRSLMLEELNIHGSSLIVVPTEPAQLAKLRSLTVNSTDMLDLGDLHALMRASPNLTHIQISSGSDVKSVHPQATLVHLSQLTHLILHLKSALVLPSLLSCLTCPSLATLSIDIPGRAPPVEHLQAVYEFLARPSTPPPVTRLRLCRKPAAKRDSTDAQETMAHTLVRIVRRLRHLEEFDISGFAVSNQLIAEMQMQDTSFSNSGAGGGAGGERMSLQMAVASNANLCPRLRTFRIAWCEYTIEPQTMATMLTSRWRYGSLASASLNLWDFERLDQTSEDVRKCVKEGLKLSLSSYAE